MGGGVLSQCRENIPVSDTVYWCGFSDLSHRANHPNAVVYCQSTNGMLRHAIDTANGLSPPPLTSNENMTALPPMPQRGEVDFIFGGEVVDLPAFRWNI